MSLSLTDLKTLSPQTYIAILEAIIADATSFLGGTPVTVGPLDLDVAGVKVELTLTVKKT